jgi:hypothetical protein
MHFRIPPLPSTVKFIDAIPLEKLKTGTRAVLEVTTYPGGHVHVVASRVEGPSGSHGSRRGPLSHVP